MSDSENENENEAERFLSDEEITEFLENHSAGKPLKHPFAIIIIRGKFLLDFKFGTFSMKWCITVMF